MTRPACVVIDTEAARVNLAVVRRLAPKQKVMAIIKADAYGHGLVRIARALEQADAFGVASLAEARELRRHGIMHPTVLLEGPFSVDELTELSESNIETVIHHESQLEMLENLPAAKAVCVWLKLDTGMHRLGFPSEQADAVLSRLTECVGVANPIRLMTHLACAQERGNSMMQEQLMRFAEAVQGLAGERCIANSAAVMTCAGSHADWVRPGIMLYGVSPLNDGASEHGLRPVMTVRSALIAVNLVRAGEAVGYGATWRCPSDMQVGIVAFGYGDGYPRHAPSGTPILVNGRRAALIGKASMDMLTVDLRGIPDAKVGDPVVLWGEGLPVEEVAQCADTIPYELLCGVRVRARFVELARYDAA